MGPRIRVGVIGWNHPEWKGSVYPAEAEPGDFLRHYAARFPIVEAASSYYGMPRTRTVASWASHTPEGFEMSLKVPDWIVRKKADDPDLPKALETLLTHLEPLRAAGKLGTLVAQFHPSFRREKRADDLAAFVRLLPEGARWAVELRDPSWWHDETYRTLSDAGVILVWSALGGIARTPPVVTSESLYLRIFGDRALEPPYDRKRRDGREELAHWAEAIVAASPAVRRVDVLVSKYLEGYAPETAVTMSELLHVPPPPLDVIGPRQATIEELVR